MAGRNVLRRSLWLAQLGRRGRGDRLGDRRRIRAARRRFAERPWATSRLDWRGTRVPADRAASARAPACVGLAAAGDLDGSGDPGARCGPRAISRIAARDDPMVQPARRVCRRFAICRAACRRGRIASSGCGSAASSKRVGGLFGIFCPRSARLPERHRTLQAAAAHAEHELCDLGSLRMERRQFPRLRAARNCGSCWRYWAGFRWVSDCLGRGLPWFCCCCIWL